MIKYVNDELHIIIENPGDHGPCHLSIFQALIDSIRTQSICQDEVMSTKETNYWLTVLMDAMLPGEKEFETGIKKQILQKPQKQNP